MNNVKLNFVLKSEKDKNKPALLYLMYTWDKRYKISLGHSILPKYWDKENACAIISSQQTQQEQRVLKRLNKFLDEIKNKIECVFSDYRYHPKKDAWAGLDVKRSIVAAIRICENKEQDEVDLTHLKPSAFFQRYADNVCNKVVKRTGTFISKGTQVNHYVVLRRYRDYLTDMRKVDEFHIFDETFEENFELWCLKKRGYTSNTIAASFSIFKIWLKEAEKQGLLKNKAFHSFKTKAVGTQHQYLNEEEIQRLYEIVFTEEFKKENNIDFKSHIEETRDLFVIACNLGLRLSDWGVLNNSEWNWKDNTISIITTKTKEKVVIPISTQVKEIYKKYDGIFPLPIYKSSLNKQIQLICKIAGINNDIYVLENKHGETIRNHYKKYELITSHTGRRSFATNLYLKSKNAKMVMAFTGHKTEENFFRYICVSKEENAKLAQGYFK